MRWRYFVAVGLAGLVTAAVLASNRDDLFNGIRSDSQAIKRHERAWARSFGQQITLEKLKAAVGTRGGNCVPIPAQQRANNNGRSELSCEVSVPGTFPTAIGFSYYWIVVLEERGHSWSPVKVQRRKIGL